jgi:uncharacterized protein
MKLTRPKVVIASIASSAQDDAAPTAARGRRPLLPFFVLVFALSVPFWLVGAWTGRQLLEGLPVSALMAICPLIAASVLVYRERQIAGVTALLQRAFDYQRIRAKVWYLPILLLMPGVMVVSYGLMRVLRLPLPSPHFPVLTAPVLFLAFFVTALGEEVGWMGYAIDPLQARWNALQASLILGAVWATWHVVPLLQAHRSLAWIAWWSLATVASRVLIVWLYTNTGKSVFAAILFHAMSNVSTFLFPNSGSHYDPRITGLLVAILALIVTIVWGPQTLARSGKP